MADEREIDELSERLMLKLSPVNVDKRKFYALNTNENVTEMVVDDKNCQIDSKIVNCLNFQTANSCDNSGTSSTLQFSSRSISLPPRKTISPNQRINLINKNIRRFEDRAMLGEESQNVIPMSSKESKSSMPLNSNTSTERKNMDNYRQHINLQNSHELIRLMFSAATVLFTIYVVFGVIFIIKNDIESKIQISITNIIDEMNICSKQYIDNKCYPDQRVPAMEDKCIEWEKCMSQNPRMIAKKSIFTAQIIGEIINTFFDQISFKSALFIFGFIIAIVIGNYLVITSSIHRKTESYFSKRKMLL